MSHLISARIDGLAGRKGSIEFEFDRHLNIMFGLNGSGKTSLLKILHSAMSGDATFLESVPFTGATVQIYSVNYKKIFSRHIVREKTPKEEFAIKPSSEIEVRVEIPEFVRRRLSKEAKLRWVETPREKKKGQLTHWQHRYLPTARLHVTDDYFLQSSLPRYAYDELTEEILDNFFADSVKRLWSSYSSEVLRAVRDAQEKGLASILEVTLSPSIAKRRQKESLDLDKAYESVKKFLERQGSLRLLGTLEGFKKRYKKDETTQKIVQDILLIEQKIDKAMTARRQLRKLIENLYSGDKHVIFEDDEIYVKNSDGKQIGLASLSSGEKHLLRILVEALLAGESTILIDEPELSMHIDWQHDLVSNIRLLNPNTQLILATHSPEIMAEISDDRIFSL
jgi:predicted ATP-dependent endonuclease of OLD family